MSTHHSRVLRLPWLLLAALLIGVAAFIQVLVSPLAAANTARGLYEPEAATPPFQWSSSRVYIPLNRTASLTTLTLNLASGAWEGRAPQYIALNTPHGEVVRLVPDARLRRYTVLLPPTDAVTLHTPVARPPGDDPRWLGVQVRTISGKALGLPDQALLRALLIGLFSLPLLFGWAWCVQRGHGTLAAITVLALGVRVYNLNGAPAGFFQDEAVSLVDAWSLLQTGRDHLGQAWPLGAFEAFGDWVSPLLTYLQLPLVAILGPTPEAGRLVAALAGTLAVPVAALVARELRLPWPAVAVVALVVALSPWQILRTRIATPPALVPLCWGLVIWAGLRLIHSGARRDAMLLALTAGVGLHAYPPLKMAVPLLAAAAIGLAILHQYSAAPQPSVRSFLGVWFRRWWPAGVLLALLWLPFVWMTVFNEASGMRAGSKLLRTDSAIAWVAAWLSGYASYFQAGFYYLTGDASNGIPDQGVQLSLEAPLVLLGIGGLLWHCLKQPSDAGLRSPDRQAWWFLLAALLIAPLPASLMTPNPHLTRALAVAPGYAILIGLGVSLLWQATRQPFRAWVLAGIAALLIIQGGFRYVEFQQQISVILAGKYQDGLRETIELAVRDYADNYDEVWVEDEMPFPYIHVLLAQAMPAAEAQATIIVQRPITTFNTVTQVGKYRFRNMEAIPFDLPTMEATVNSLGKPRFVLQELQENGQRVLIVRKQT